MKKEKKEKKPVSKTRKSYNRWRTLKWSLYTGKYVLPLVPACVMAGLNWEEWAAQAGNHWSIGLGFGSLLLAVLITIFGVAKKDEILQENISPQYPFAVLMAIWAVAFLFLSSIMEQLGLMLLYTVAGLIGGGTCDQVNRTKVKKEVEFYRGLVDENELSPRAKKRAERRQRAIEEAEREKQERQATE